MATSTRFAASSVLSRREQIDAALMLAATAGRFDDGALVFITDHLSVGRPQLELVRAEERHSAQPGTSAWEVLA